MPSIKKQRVISVLFTTSILVGLSCGVSSAKEVTSDWVKLCTKDNNNQNICTTLKNVFSDTGQPLTTINIIDYDGEKHTRRLQVAVPTGRRVQEGLKIQVDNSKAQKMDYLFCVGLSCVAEGALDQNLLDSLKNGKKMTITSVNYEGRVNPIEVSLAGFSKAFASSGMRASDVAEQQQKMIENLDAHEKDFEKKLQAAQDKAKQQK